MLDEEAVHLEKKIKYCESEVSQILKNKLIEGPWWCA